MGHPLSKLEIAPYRTYAPPPMPLNHASAELAEHLERIVSDGRSNFDWVPVVVLACARASEVSDLNVKADNFFVPC